MSEKLFKINRMMVICDFLLTCIAVTAFSAGAWYFAKWWIALFALIPLGMYTTHGIITDADVERAIQQAGDSDE